MSDDEGVTWRVLHEGGDNTDHVSENAKTMRPWGFQQSQGGGEKMERHMNALWTEAHLLEGVHSSSISKTVGLSQDDWVENWLDE